MVDVFLTETLFAMELVTILNHCHHFQGFVYQHARLVRDENTMEVIVRPRQGSAAVCSGCHQPAPGYDHLAERRFEFIPFWGILVFFLYCMRRVNCRNCGIVVEEVPWGDGKHQLTKAYMLFWPAGHVSFPGKRPPSPFTRRGTRSATLSSMS